MKSLSLILILGCLCLALATPDQWTRANLEVEDDHLFSFKVALKPQNLETMDRMFWEVSNPQSPFYGNFLTNEQIADLISLPAENIKQVQDFLEATSGSVCEVQTTLGVHRDYIYVDTCAAQAKLIFPNLDLAVYERKATGEQILRSTMLVDIAHNSYLLGVPHELHQFIETIQEVTDLPLNPKTNFNPSQPWLNSDKELTIKDMIDYFGIDYSDLEESSLKGDNGQIRAGVIEMGIAFSKTGLAKFQEKYDVPSNPIRKVIGTAIFPNEEANLDVQTLTGIAQNVQVWDFVFGGSFDFAKIVEKITTTDGAPKVYSFSFGLPETVVGQSQVNAGNTSLMKFGLAGFTFVAASGDSGPVLNPSNCSIFDAEYPSASPYVLAVGGTALNNSTGIEGAWIHSSGGFSVYNTRPSFQDTKVEAYLKSGSLPTNSNSAKYNTANRAYPDVSAFGAFEPVWNSGSFSVVGGTSGAAPQFAAILSMINIVRFQNGVGPIGAPHQALYQLESGVGRDVTHGMNYATSRFGCSGQYLPGFPAVTGWDASTGLGSPKWSTLVAGLGGKTQSAKKIEEVKQEKEFLPLN